MKALAHWIALEALVVGAPKLACQHVLKFVSLVGQLADRRYRYGKMQQRLIVPAHLDQVELQKRATYEHLNVAIRHAGLGQARTAFTYFFNAFTTLDLPQFRESLVEAMFGNPAPLHRGSRVSDAALWGPENVKANDWKIVECERKS